MTDTVEGISSSDSSNSSSSIMAQWLATQEDKSQDSSQQVGAGSVSFQLEMQAAMNSITQGSSAEQKEASQDAQDEGFQAPPVPIF